MKKRIVCFGDSNTWGETGVNGIRYEDDVRWTGRLQALLGDGYTVIEEGQNGRTSVWDDPVENRLAGLTYLWPCMETHHPFDLLIIMLGTNDAKCYFGVQAQSIAQGVGRLVDMAQKCPFGRDNRPPKVLMISPIRIEYNDVFAYMFGEQGVAKSKDFPKAYKAVAEQYGCHYLNAADYAEPCEADGIHINREGHENLARAICEKVKQILAED